MLEKIYEELYNAYGPQDWWPADEPFEVVVGAILTQNVSWSNVIKAIRNLKERDVLSFEGMKNIPTEELALLIKPTGYYNSKAKKLKAFLSYLEEYGSLENLFRKPLESLRTELQNVYGIGPETADAILCYAGEYPVMVIDAYTIRILSRMGIADVKADYHEIQELFHRELSGDTQLYNEYHALLTRLAKEVCLKKKPLCASCSLVQYCKQIGVE